jgi:hypothetical protein
VEDIFVQPDGSSSRKPHNMTSFARMEDGRLFYPPDQQLISFQEHP